MKRVWYLMSGIISLMFGALATAHPLEGTWYNSYCSRIDLSVSNDGLIQGEYTSHTGSTGSSLAIGQLDPESSPTATEGTPFSLGIQWRLVNVDQTDADGSWHWVSMFSGQYHPAQEVSEPDQDPYSIPETLEILNLLIATATLPPLADTAPVTWPQTLDFHKSLPGYCHSVEPGKPVPYTPTASDNISGVWLGSSGERIDLRADKKSGAVTGSFTDQGGEKFNVTGYFDTLAPPSSSKYSVAWQGLTLSLLETGSGTSRELKALAGGVDYADTSTMYLWASDLRTTSWTDRFIQQSLDMTEFSKQ